METAALVASPAHQRPRVLLWAACGTACIVAVWCAATASAALSNAHVRVQPGLDVQVGALVPQRRLQRSAPLAPVAPTTALGAAAAPVVVAAPVAGFALAPWLSWAALLLSAAVAFFTFFKRPEAPAPAAVDYYRALPEPEEAVPRRKGGRIDQVAQGVKDELARRKNLSPKQVILELQQGNARFFSGAPDRPEMQAIERRALIVGQAPTVAILSCSDSRVPVEILFDQSLGDVFVVRVAGNILDPTAIGSLEFSVKYLGVKVLLVMGHEGCGAVKGAMSMSPSDVDQQPENLQGVLKSIKANLNLDKLNRIRDGRAQDREAIVVNVSSQVKRLQQNPLMAERIANGSLLVCGAFYEITSGIVDFFSLDKNGLVIDV